ncbi:glutamate ABC transporter substrate-binding protein [Streptomyces sp. 7-21]|jgi:glutamate transport system substrate-binding protein|uniref:glutamate ABC transporter substrate-binding protein n=1 Tax=Streptomyces sp. 7-21 TaxID=2802283 RepID=UPI00191F56E9|nr:glutamate ABC transporter substrate-binding protein [Streptomyces sp. 7-21]MBL1067135.1 glutamate ABC transporter substrate-binding protein [Streptomyces sp. 7-21]
MRFRKTTTLAAVAAALSLTATACGSGGGDSDSIRIGIKFDQPGLGLQEPGGDYTGFDVDVATYVAEELGYAAEDIEWVEAPSPERETMLNRGDVDFIVATYSITPERDEQVDFAGPYLVTHQDLLIREGEEVPNEEAINDLTLCSVSGSTSAQNVKDTFAPRADLQEYNTYSQCLTGLENGTVDALTTDASILAGYAAQEQNQGKFALAGLELSTENYGIGVPDGETDLRDDINAALEQMIEDGSWQEFVDANFGPAGYDAGEPPTIGEVVE